MTPALSRRLARVVNVLGLPLDERTKLAEEGERSGTFDEMNAWARKVVKDAEWLEDPRNSRALADVARWVDRLLAKVPGRPSRREVMAVLVLDDGGLKAAAAEALNDPEGVPVWKSRLLAWKLEGGDRELRGRGRGRRADLETLRRFHELRDEGMTYGEAVAELSPHDDPYDRATQKKVSEKATRSGMRPVVRYVELLAAASKVMAGR